MASFIVSILLIIYFSTLFVKDAFSDLPHEADLSATGKESLKSWQRAYDSAPQSHFQRKMRKMSTDLIDHLSQRPNPLNQARYVVGCRFKEAWDKGASDQGAWPKGHHTKGALPKGHLIQKGHCSQNDQISSPNKLQIRSPGILFLNFALGDKG